MPNRLVFVCMRQVLQMSKRGHRLGVATVGLDGRFGQILDPDHECLGVAIIRKLKT